MAKVSVGTRNLSSKSIIGGGEFYDAMRKDSLGLLYEQRTRDYSNQEERKTLKNEGFDYVNLGIRGEYIGTKIDDKHVAVLNEVGRQKDGTMAYNVIPMYHRNDIPEGENWVKGTWTNGSKLSDTEYSKSLKEIPAIIAQWKKQARK